MSVIFDDLDFHVAAACSHCSTCVAVAHKENIVAVRDTKDTLKTTLQFTKDEWQVFIEGVKRGEFDF